MTEQPDEPTDSGEALARAMIRLRNAVLRRENNPGVKEWERVNNRNNFASGIERAMRGGAA